jgi:hypothetical protein
MRSSVLSVRWLLAPLFAAAAVACAVEGSSGTAEDELSRTRGIVGVPGDLPVKDKSFEGSARLNDELSGDMKKRRDHAWEVLGNSSRPYKTSIAGTNVNVPLWMTWYEGEEIGEILQVALDGKKNGANVTAAPTLSDSDIDVAMKLHAKRARGVHKSASFKKPLLTNNGHAGTSDPQTRDLIATTGFTLFSPAYVRHVLRNYKSVASCGTQGSDKPAVFDRPAFDAKVHSGNFAAPCFDSEFPADAVMAKAIWQPLTDPVSYYDTGATGLTKIFADVDTTWSAAELGTKQIDPNSKTDMVIAKDDQGAAWGLLALHLSTKETRNWVWSTYFWSPDEVAKQDFGADRDAQPFFSGAAPDESTKTLREALNNYKMCTTSDFAENDAQLATRYGDTGDLGTLTSALLKADELVNAGPRRIGAVDSGAFSGANLFGKAAPRSTWCSNPYVETHPGNTHTNCIGCHQHAATGVAFNETFYLETPKWSWGNFPKFGTTKVRGLPRAGSTAPATTGTFPTDFSWGGEFEIRPLFQDAIRRNFSAQ